MYETMYVTFIVILCSIGVAGLIYQSLFEKQNYAKKSIKEAGVYKEYETAPSIAALWYSQKAVGLCDRCGMNDAPIVVYNEITKQSKCKWCAELDNLRYHLQRNGIRKYLEILGKR